MAWDGMRQGGMGWGEMGWDGMVGRLQLICVPNNATYGYSSTCTHTPNVQVSRLGTCEQDGCAGVGMWVCLFVCAPSSSC